MSTDEDRLTNDEQQAAELLARCIEAERGGRPMTNTEAWWALADEKDQEIARLRDLIRRASEQAIKTGLKSVGGRVMDDVNYHKEGTSMWACELCGAIVAHKGAHNRWHAGMAKLFESVGADRP